MTTRNPHDMIALVNFALLLRGPLCVPRISGKRHLMRIIVEGDTCKALLVDADASQVSVKTATLVHLTCREWQSLLAILGITSFVPGS